MKRRWARKQWWEVWFTGPHTSSQGKRLDARRRSKDTAERVALNLRASRNYFQVWLVEVNRL